jgi:SAM-dependent methyltransferase
VILQKAVYGGRSLEHHRLAQRRPELCLGEDDGLFAALEAAFARQAEHLSLLFDPRAPGVALRPSAAALKQAVAALSDAPSEVFQAADALGWAYQYWNTEEKDRVFEKVRTERGAKIAGADIIPTTQLYTEPYMVKFLVQNSLGALWLGMHPDSRLAEGWEYYVRDADRTPVERKPLREVTFLDPACGSGHFLLEAFDLFYAMYEEEATGDRRPTMPAEICAAILQHNLYGIDIDERAVQIAEAALWMKAAEKAFDFRGTPANLVATNIRLPKAKDHLAAFLTQHPEDRDLRPALEVIFEGLAHADELGSLLQLEEPVEKELRYLQAKMEERRGKPEQTVMFAELEKPKQGELPVGVESYEAWKVRTLARLKAHFATEAQAADLSQAFFGRSAEKGVRLFDLLARRYDVVAANPPYMGSGNMGSAIKKYVEIHYTSGKRDLYAAFILRCLGLTIQTGRVAMVTQQSWMFLSSFVDMRVVKNDKIIPRVSSGLLSDTSLESLVHLGPGAFGEISGEVVNTVLFVLAYVAPDVRHRLVALCLVAPKNPEEKTFMLQRVISNNLQEVVFHPVQTDFLAIPQSRIMYSASPTLFKLFRESSSWDREDFNSSFAAARRGLDTCDVKRWVRFWWEVPGTQLSLCQDDRVSRPWVRHARGSNGFKWAGRFNYAVKWGVAGENLKIRSTAIIPNEQFYFERGATFSRIGQTISARVLPAHTLISDSASGVYSSKVSPYVLVGLLNSRVVSLLLSLINPTMNSQTGDINALPVPLDERILTEIDRISRMCGSQRERLVTSDPIEYDFLVSEGSEPSIFDSASRRLLSQLEIECAYTFLKGEVDTLSGLAFLADSSLIETFGSLSTDYHLIAGFDDVGSIKHFNSDLVETYRAKYLPRSETTIKDTDLRELNVTARSLFEVGPGSGLSENEASSSDIDVSEELDIETRISIPPETFLEEISTKVQIHPISTLLLLERGIDEENWRCLPEERRITADRFTVLILRLLGHRWPKQIEAGEAIPDWANPDGIIPLTEGTTDPTLLARIRERLPIEFPGGEVAALEREFQELMGESLEAWLGQTFFKHHTSQFKKRPVAWQLQSGRWTARQKPAFACLVYYHQLDGDTLATLQSQYVRPLRQRYETELRGIESIPVNARSARQDARRVELGDLIQELGVFDAALGRVAAEGFASPALEQLIAHGPVDRWCSPDGVKPSPEDRAALLRQEQRYLPDLNDGVRVNIAPLQKAGLLAAEVLAKKDLEQAIADRAEWRADERRWCREGKLPRPGWWE